MTTYSPLSVEEGNNNEQSNQVRSLSYDTAIPISRTPTNPRDIYYWSLYFLCFFACSIMGFIRHSGFLEDSFVLYEKAGGWTSMLMVSTLFGYIIGVAVSLGLGYAPIRDFLLEKVVIYSIGIQILASITILLLLGFECWPISIIILSGAICDATRLSTYKEASPFIGEQISTSMNILNEYGTSFIISMGVLGTLQTALLLWLGVIFVGLLTEVHAGIAALLIMFMAFTFFWTVQLFQAVVSTVSGSCVMWYFIREDGVELDARKRVKLYTQTALTASLGTLCKGALIVPLAQSILSIDFWANDVDTPGLGLPMETQTRRIMSVMTREAATTCRRFSRLIYSVIGLYSQSFNKTVVYSYEDQCVNVILESTCNLFLKSIATALSLSMMLFFAAVGHHDPSMPLFLCISYFLIFAGTSLMLTSIRSGVDSLVLAFTANPSRLAVLSPVVFQRYLRATSDEA